jgi:hypothetical protein
MILPRNGKQDSMDKEKAKTFVWGLVAGIVVAFVGGVWIMGWFVRASTAELAAAQRVEKAIVTALTPICVERFRKDPALEANLAALKELRYSWTQREYIMKGSWADDGAVGKDGKKTMNFALGDACVAALAKM